MHLRQLDLRDRAKKVRHAHLVHRARKEVLPHVGVRVDRGRVHAVKEVLERLVARAVHMLHKLEHRTRVPVDQGDTDAAVDIVLRK